MNQIVSLTELPTVLADVAKLGARPFGVYLETYKPLLKRDRITREPHAYGATVRKLSKLSAFFNFEYQKSVNRQRVREHAPATFTAEANWFIHSPICRALVEHDGKQYVQLKVERSIWRRYYCADREVTADELKNLLPVICAPAKQALENPVLTITPNLESILAFTCNGITYCVGRNYNVEQLGEAISIAPLVTARI